MKRAAFALPTVLIASVVMLMVLATAVSATAAVRNALQNQYYNGIADDAANAGEAFAQSCLAANNNRMTWSDSKPLRPNTDCNGDYQSGLSAYVSSYSDYRTYFIVGALPLDQNSRPTSVSAQGYVELLRASSGMAWRVFSGDTVSALATPGDGTPVGASIEGYWSTAPQGYLLENGQAVSRTTYAALFAVIGTTYGAGDGSTTFNVPDSRGRVMVARSTDTEFDTMGEKGGAKTHVLSVTEMPSHTHAQNSHSHSQASHSHSVTGPTGGGLSGAAGGGASYSNGAGYAPWFGGGWSSGPATISSTAPTINGTTATNQNTGGDGAHNNLQPYITATRAIKY